MRKRNLNISLGKIVKNNSKPLSELADELFSKILLARGSKKH
jgi:hypothetical protein